MQSRTYMPDPDAPLVETDWLAKRLGDDRLHVIEVGRDANEYERGHIPGAVAWTCGTDLHTQSNPLPICLRPEVLVKGTKA